MAASSLIEYCFEEIQLDLTPGANDRNSAPEHLWNGARWWTEAFGEFDRPIHGPLRAPRPALPGARPGRDPAHALMDVIRPLQRPAPAAARPTGSPGRS